MTPLTFAAHAALHVCHVPEYLAKQRLSSNLHTHLTAWLMTKAAREMWPASPGAKSNHSTCTHADPGRLHRHAYYGSKLAAGQETSAQQGVCRSHLQAAGQAVGLLPWRAQHLRLVRACAHLQIKVDTLWRLTSENQSVRAQGSQCVTLTAVGWSQPARIDRAARKCKQLRQPGCPPGADLLSWEVKPSAPEPQVTWRSPTCDQGGHSSHAYTLKSEP